MADQEKPSPQEDKAAPQATPASAARMHEELNDFTAQDDKERQQNVTKQYFDDITSAINAMKLRHGGKYSAHVADLLLQVREKPSEDMNLEWERRRNEMLEKNRKIRNGEMQGILLTTADLEKETSELEFDLKALQDTIIEGYLRKMTEDSDGKDLTPEVLEEMLESTHASVNKMIEIFNTKKQYPEMVEALNWSLGLGKDGKALSASKEAAFKAVSKHLMANTPYVAPLCWTIVNYMDGKDRREFAQKFIVENKLTPDRAYQFMHVGINMGAFSPLEMQETLLATMPEDKKEEMLAKFKGGEKQYKAVYTAQHNFQKGAERMLHQSYDGSLGTNMITGKNIAIFILETAAVATMAGNTAVALLKDRGNSWINVGNLTSLIKNKYFVGAGAVLGAIHLLKKPQQLSGFFKEKGEREAQENAYYKRQFRDRINGTPAWDGFFKDNDYEGLQALWSYLKEIEQTKSPKRMLKIAKFKEWLGKNSDKKGSEGYAKLSERLSKIDTNDDEFKIIAKAVNELGMGKTDAKAEYKDAMGRTKKIDINNVI